MPSAHGPKCRAFYKSSLWRRTKDAYLSKVNGICEICGKPASIVHHKTVEVDENTVDDLNITTGEWNLQAVCIDCHNRLHFGDEEGQEANPRVEFDSDGNCKVVSTPVSGVRPPTPRFSSKLRKDRRGTAFLHTKQK